MLQRPTIDATTPGSAASIADEVLRSPGRPLDEATQAFFGSRFARDFSRVQNHSAVADANQSELTIGPVDDGFEREADSVAERVTAHAAPAPAEVPDGAWFDLSHVRVHTDDRAADSARAVQARAYTVGRDVVFGRGEYEPETSEGRRLLAHELTHVSQQSTARRTARVQRAVAETNFPGGGRVDDVRTGEHRVWNFDVGKSTLKPEHLRALRRIAQEIKDSLDPADKEQQVDLEGQASSTGAAARNDELALERARAVRQTLLDEGVAEAKIRITAVGAAKSEVGTQEESFAHSRAVRTGELEAAPDMVHDVLRSPGQPLDAATRGFFEPRFGQDFSGVRVHADARAAESARSVNALAYTVGREVVFDTGQYAPETSQGRQLMAHELTHVVQQSRNHANSAEPIAIASDNHFESEAERFSSLGAGSTSALHRLSGTIIQRQGAPAGGGAAAPATHRFAAEGVSVIVRGSCAPDEFGFANVEEGVRAALDAIFNTECIEASRRTRMQRNLRAHGLDVRCQLSANLVTPGSCAESTGFFIPANIFTLGSRSFSSHPDSDDACQPIESTILHEIVHLTRGFGGELLPDSCEASCFGVGGADPALCRDIDVFGNRHAA